MHVDLILLNVIPLCKSIKVTFDLYNAVLELMVAVMGKKGACCTVFQVRDV